jgi:hypothetical protein
MIRLYNYIIGTVHRYTYICTCIYMYSCIYIYKYIFIYIHIFTGVGDGDIEYLYEIITVIRRTLADTDVKCLNLNTAEEASRILSFLVNLKVLTVRTCFYIYLYMKREIKI